MQTEQLHFREEEIRAMRNIVFESDVSDKSWLYTKEHWTRPDSVEWLVEQVEKIKSKEAK